MPIPNTLALTVSRLKVTTRNPKNKSNARSLTNGRLHVPHHEFVAHFKRPGHGDACMCRGRQTRRGSCDGSFLRSIQIFFSHSEHSYFLRAQQVFVDMTHDVVLEDRTEVAYLVHEIHLVNSISSERLEKQDI